MEIKRLNSAKSIYSAFKEHCNSNPEKVLFCFPRSGNDIFETRNEVLLKVKALAATLQSKGVTSGSRVGIISNTRAEWIIADLAILSLGAVSVSVYQSLLAADIAYILFDAEVTHLFIENSEQLNKIKELISKSWDIVATEDREATTKQFSFDSIISFEKIENNEGLDDIINFNDACSKNENIISKDNIERSALASLVYTSGTTGPPKGVIQTHENHLSNVRQVMESGLIINGASIFLFLPLAHSFARLMAYIAVTNNISLVLPEVSDPKNSKLNPALLLRDMAHSNCEIIPIVPRFLEKIKDQLESQATKNTVTALMLRLALSKYGFLVPFIKSKIKKKIFGEKFKYAVSGGAKLGASINSFFHNLGITILEGYGLTETVVATNACTLKYNKIGSVGKVLASDILIKIFEDGEIAYKGPNISSGYLGRPTATRKSFTEDGWFLTGDLGRVDEEGYLYVEGRKKEIIVTSGGKKIAPLPIEEKINNSPYISQSVLFGDGMKYLVVLITINKEYAKNCLKLNNQDLENPSECAALVKEISAHIDRINAELASFETIKKFHIANQDPSVENSMLTPSMKIKRNAVAEAFKKELEALY